MNPTQGYGGFTEIAGDAAGDLMRLIAIEVGPNPDDMMT
jgi:hypothetical protein